MQSAFSGRKKQIYVTDGAGAAIHYFYKDKMISYKLQIFKALYFIGSQFKGRTNFINLAHHYQDYNVRAEWIFGDYFITNA